MNTYHPQSWSAQAREKADRLYNQWKSAVDRPEEFYYGFKYSNWDPRMYAQLVSDSYRAEIIKGRAAKRLGRKFRNAYHKLSVMPERYFTLENEHDKYVYETIMKYLAKAGYKNN